VNRMVRRSVRAVLAAAALTALASGVASAHVPEMVGPFATEVGWLDEPAVQGQMNGLDIRILTRAEDKPVSGAEKTLKAEIGHGGRTKTVDLEPQHGKPGAYTAAVLPTRPGAYTVRLFGTVDGTPFDATYDLGGDSDSVVVPLDQVAFPAGGPAVQAGEAPQASGGAAPSAASPTSTSAASSAGGATATAASPAAAGPQTPSWAVWLSLALALLALVNGGMAWRAAGRARRP
jgi:hypothetical protein